MSMLAEKKRREKWSLNPRGKAWSEDQNKFGQRLMEKMGWKAGQGLGSNSQGQTDIVKTRVKNDSKGLGFKENGEEWLKTTSDFDNLLEELASNQEDSGEGSQAETPASLEDRSKKSRARVHYHKFTRGKDLSRYSEKDLASIIGPDVIKTKNGQESKNDYTQNQVNKGSLEEYFHKKLKSKNLLNDNLINGEITGDLEENVINPECLVNNRESLKINQESVVPVSTKKLKKNKTSVKENIAQINNSEASENCEDDNNLHGVETEISGKRKRKRKSDCSIEDNSCDHEENESNDLDSSIPQSSKRVKKEIKNNTKAAEHETPKESFDNFQMYNINFKKGKTSNENLSQDVENSVSEDSGHIRSNSEGKPLKTKKRKVRQEETEQSKDNDISTNINSLSADPVVEGDIVIKKKKKKARDGNKEHCVDFNCDEECTTNNLLVSVIDDNIATKKKKKTKDKNDQLQDSLMEALTDNNNIHISNNTVASEEAIISDEPGKKKKKKSKDKNKTHQDDSVEIFTDISVVNTNNNPVVSEETVVSDKLIDKNKKKKTKNKNKDYSEETLEKEQLEVKKEYKQDDSGISETAPPNEQVNNDVCEIITSSSVKKKKKHKKDKQQ